MKETWRDVVPIADKAAELFYKRLFEIDPSLHSHASVVPGTQAPGRMLCPHPATPSVALKTATNTHVEPMLFCTNIAAASTSVDGLRSRP